MSDQDTPKTAFRPGPWTAEYDRVINIWAVMDSQRGVVAVFNGSDEMGAVARLLAAAPELLATCEALVYAGAAAKRPSNAIAACIDQAQAAVTKAQGETT